MHRKVQVKVFGNVPKYATEGSSGFDFEAAEDCFISPKGICLVKTGMFVEIPDGFELQVRPRSGLALKHGITVLNTPGTVDCDYRNEVGVILYNASHKPYQINKGDRIAQGVICPVVQADWCVVDSVEELSSTERNLGGFGSTGK